MCASITSRDAAMKISPHPASASGAPAYAPWRRPAFRLFPRFASVRMGQIRRAGRPFITLSAGKSGEFRLPGRLFAGWSLFRSGRAMQTAPDWDTSPREPACAAPRAKVALRPNSGRMMPRQFGPRTRIRWRRALASIACSSAAPCVPVSENPAAARNTCSENELRSLDILMTTSWHTTPVNIILKDASVRRDMAHQRVQAREILNLDGFILHGNDVLALEMREGAADRFKLKAEIAANFLARHAQNELSR